MRALRVTDEKSKAQITEMDLSNLTKGDVVIKVRYSSLNYKDALAVTSTGRILKKYPLNPGIDASGIVVSDTTDTFKAGDKVIMAGHGLGEEMDGGFGDHIRVPAQNVIPLPPGMDLKQTMVFGTAGFTAALAIHRMLQNGQTKDKGPILVTGATGGVGSIAISLLRHLGFEAWALTGKKESQHDYLRMLGAHKIVTKDELELGSRPLEKTKFGGAIDNLGGETLSQILPHIALWGNVASIGLAESAELKTTVMPFILRGVSILGVSSNNCAHELRKSLWNTLGHEWNSKYFKNLHIKTIGLKDVLQTADDMLNRKTTGRILVEHSAE